MTRYCAYIFKKGSNKGKQCNEVCYLDTTFCKKHSKNTDKFINYKQDKNNKNVKQDKNIKNENIKTKDLDRKDLPTVIHINKIVNKKLQEESIREKILELSTNDINKSVIFKHYNNMKRTDSNSTEYYKNQLFVDTSLSYPWNNYYNINDLIKDQSVVDFLKLIQTNFDKEIYGMDSVKNEILNVVCKFITNPSSNRNNIALYGAAGVGKSKFIKVLSDTLGLPMKVISLGGIKDSSFFLGHGYVYVESGPGKILQNIIDSKVSNPILYFDELDKVSETDNGKDIFSFLCYLTDPTQNNKFTDHYFYGMQFDLSKVFYVFTFNDIDKIDKILLDRLNVIKVNTPNEDDIIHILERHCIPEIIQNIGIQKNVTFAKSSIEYIINFCQIDKNVTSGIREYYRIIEKILLQLNKDILTNTDTFLLEQDIVLQDKTFTNLFDKIKDQLNYTEQYTSYLHMYI
jgi:ATP-dependent Lon protease